MRAHFVWTWVFLLAAVLGQVRGEDDFVRIPRAEYEALKSKAARVDQLEKELGKITGGQPATSVPVPAVTGLDPQAQLKAREKELAAAKAEIDRLKHEQKRLVSDAHPINPAVLNAFKNLPAPRPLADLKPIAADETIPVHEILAHYAADPVAADARYKKKIFHLQGTVVDVEKSLLSSNFNLFFRIPDYAGQVICEAHSPDKYQRVYASSDRMRIVGEIAARYPTTLAAVGSEMNFIVKCLGSKNGSVLVDTVMIGR
ncbi:MAG TPA: hypothetical protein VMF06_03870 [Candidatus Limnocylindria bacterium]|jgi:hypothetical protein|nr:hypothetical protein [Candidatus Limnocylindria bacterium]